MTRILIADSDRIVRSSIALLIKHKLGIRQIYEIDHAGLLAERLKQSAPNILIIDWDLPGLSVGQISGICSEFHHSSGHPLVIVMSTNAENEPWALANGADAFLNKRASGEEVLALLKKFIPPDLVTRRP